jgi:hypothetical protein
MAAAGILVLAPGSVAAVGIVVDVSGLAMARRIFALGGIGQEVVQIVPGAAAPAVPGWRGGCRAAGCGWLRDRMYPLAR